MSALKHDRRVCVSDRLIKMIFFSCSIKEGVLKEVLGIMVSYKVMVKVIIGGLVIPVCVFV